MTQGVVPFILGFVAVALLAVGQDKPLAQAQPRIGAAPVRPPAPVLHLPKKAGSVRFAAIGDSGRGHGP
jgi:hypothetical protein